MTIRAENNWLWVHRILMPILMLILTGVVSVGGFIGAKVWDRDPATVVSELNADPATVVSELNADPATSAQLMQLHSQAATAINALLDALNSPTHSKRAQVAMPPYWSVMDGVFAYNPPPPPPLVVTPPGPPDNPIPLPQA